MAKAKRYRKLKSIPKISETEGGNFGDYDEANGGGSPKGGIWGGRNGRVGWDKRIEEGEVAEGQHRTDQPRTSDGKFTYNSVNGKETKYPGRGETINPLLTGGQNGIKIENVKSEFKAKSGSLYERFKDRFYQKQSLKATREKGKYKIKISSEDIWEIARGTWDVKKGELKGESQVWEKSKPGKSDVDEKAAKEAAKKSQSEQYVKAGSFGGIKQLNDRQIDEMAKSLNKIKAKTNLKHSSVDLKAYRQQFIDAGKDMSNVTDEQLDQMLTEAGL